MTSNVTGASFRIREDRGDHSLQVAAHTGTIVAKYIRDALYVLRARIAGNQVFNQLLADERRHRVLRHQRIQHRFQILLRGLPGWNVDAPEDGLRAGVVIAFHREHLTDVVRRIVAPAARAGRGRIGPPRQRLGHVRDHRLVISGNRMPAGIEDRASIRIQLCKSKREQLHQLARIILVRGCVLRWIGLVVIGHVQVAAHGRTQRYSLDQIAVVSESVVSKNAPIGRERIRILHAGLLRHHPDLAQNERHALEKLVLPRDGIHEEGLGDRIQVVIGLAVRIQNRLIRQIGGV
jgi:hypothetical protein